MEELTLKVPKKVIIELLNQLPPKELDDLIDEVVGKKKIKLVTVEPESLDLIKNIIAVGGDALKDTEDIYE